MRRRWSAHVVVAGLLAPSGPALAQSELVLEEEDEAPAAALDEEDEERDAPSSGARPSPLEAHLGVALYGQTYRYVTPAEQVYLDSPYAELSNYTLPAAPLPFADLTWYPGAHFGDGWFAHVGLRGGYRQNVGTKVVDATGAELSQEYSAWFAGLRVRAPFELGELGRLTLALTGEYAAQRTALNGQSAAAPQFPELDYRLLQLGGDVEWRLGGLIVGGSAAYLPVLSTGSGTGNAIDGPAWFPNAHAWGAALGARVGWELTEWADLLFGVDYRAFGLGFSPLTPEPGTVGAKIAGGATDRTVSTWLGLGLRIPESGGASSTPDGASEGAPPGGAAPADDFDSFE